MSLSLLREVARSVGGGEAILSVHAVLCTLEERYMRHNSLEKHVQCWALTKKTFTPRGVSYYCIEWILYGKWHRFADKPVFMFKRNDETGGVAKQWVYQGKRGREGDKPSFVSSTEVHWERNGKTVQWMVRLKENGEEKWVSLSPLQIPLTEYDGIPVRVAVENI